MNETKKCYVCDVIINTDDDAPRGTIIFIHKEGQFDETRLEACFLCYMESVRRNLDALKVFNMEESLFQQPHIVPTE
jgi:hypothetical protein